MPTTASHPLVGGTLRFLTTNAGKLAEAERILGPLGWTVRPFHDDPHSPPPAFIEPQADDLAAIAEAKLAQAVDLLQPGHQDAILVEDSGLFVDALHGFPGVYSAHALATIGPAGLLDLLAGSEARLPSPPPDTLARWEHRSAHFACEALLLPATEEAPARTIAGSGRCLGRIADLEGGAGGFGFDPVFIPCDLDARGDPLPLGARGVASTSGETFAAVPGKVKDSFSHRRRALEDLARQLGG